MSSLKFDNDFWEGHLSDIDMKDLNTKLHLAMSLLIFLGISFQKFLRFMFSSDISSVKTRASRFMGYTPSAKQEDDSFYPGAIFNLWHSRWPDSRPHLHQMIEPCAHEIALEESDGIIQDSSLQIRMSKLTLKGIRNLLDPKALMEKIRGLAPFVWGVLHTFSASPNEYRRRKARHKNRPNIEDTESEDWDDDPNDDVGHSEADTGEKHWSKEYDGFSRNPNFAVLLAISMLVFVRNRATNILPLILGLFFKISGTSSRTIKMLSNCGVSISIRTIERLKIQISEDAINHAIELIKSGRAWFPIFDNINIFLRKSQQRITNKNDMIHATNAAIIALDAEPDGEHTASEDLNAMLKLRGKRAEATLNDILPDSADDNHMEHTFQALIADMLVKYTPEASKWKDRTTMVEEVAKMFLEDRPLKLEKTDTRPFGVFDVNEGSKKGVVKVLSQMQKRSTLTKEEWMSKAHVVGGDWLTSNNIRAARRDRNDDIDPMERLEIYKELSMLFHHALQYGHCCIRLHGGRGATEDPTCLLAHKGLLGRTWDINKPNYAAAKALIRHSLIARLLHCTMVLKGMKTWSELGKWRPDVDEIKSISKSIFERYATTAAAEKAKAAQDDWLAHCIYFIRDALFFCEFEHAVSHADAGRVIRIFKYWAFLYRGAGQHNYARECVEVILTWKYETTPAMRAALEKSWFVNRWGLKGRWIASDLYVEQLNYWVKRVFIAQGNGVTIEYIIKSGSACVEAFRDISHTVARFFGDSDAARRSKEIKFQEDLRVMVEDMVKQNLHPLEPSFHFVAAPRPKKAKADYEVQSAIGDGMVFGAQVWQDGKFQEFMKGSTWDPAVGYPITSETATNKERRDAIFDNGTVFDNAQNPLETGSFQDLHGEETTEGLGGIGGGDEFSAGDEVE